MELRSYWQIIRRRWLLLVIPAAVVLAAGLLTYTAPPPAFATAVSFVVGQQPASGADTADEQRYYAWLNSEYIADGVVNWATSRAFANAVSERLQAAGHAIPPEAVQVAGDNSRSLVSLSLSSGDPAALALIMEAVIAELREDNAGALPQMGGDPALLTQLNEPAVSPLPAGVRSRLDLLVRIAIAAAAGIGLVFLAEYLDPTLRSRQELEALGLAVVGEIPKK